MKDRDIVTTVFLIITVRAFKTEKRQSRAFIFRHL